MRSSDITTSAGLTIPVTAVRGKGPTTLAAFDDCLRRAGVSNLNLIRLSSVIPPNTVVRAVTGEVGATSLDLRSLDRRSTSSSAEWGDRLYAVWAFESAQVLGQEAWAGVAWVQDPEDGRGLFVEHEGASEAQVRSDMAATLSHMCQARGFGDLEQRVVVAGACCEGEPVGAMVIAPYRTSGWS